MSRRVSLPAVDGTLSAADLRATVDAIATVQRPDGNIPWNLIEAAMALDVGGRRRDAERAYDWLVSMQRPDGGWHAYYVGRDV